EKAQYRVASFARAMWTCVRLLHNSRRQLRGRTCAKDRYRCPPRFFLCRCVPNPQFHRHGRHLIGAYAALFSSRRARKEATRSKRKRRIIALGRKRIASASSIGCSIVFFCPLIGTLTKQSSGDQYFVSSECKRTKSFACEIV